MIHSRLVRGISWSAAERFASQILQFGITVILARLLTPADFGLIAILNVFITLSQSIVDSGLSNALIHKTDRNEKDFSTVFYFSLALGLIFFILILVVAPYVADLYDQPRLTSLFRWMGLIPLVQGLSIIQLTKLAIQLDFKTQAKATLPAMLISAVVGIYLAYAGYGVWAIIAQLIINSLLNTLLLWLFVRWTPVFIFSMSAFSELYRYGSKLLFAGLLHTIYINAYNFVIGLKHPAAELGFFYQANLISRFPSINFMAIMTRAMFPIQCEMKSDKKALRESFLSNLRLSTFLIFPLMIGIAVLSKSLVLVILTDKWMPMAEYLSLLSIAYSLTPIMVVNNQVLLVNGRTDLFLELELVKKAAGIVIICVTIFHGLSIICWGIVIYNIIDAALGIHYAKKTIEVGYLVQIKAIYKIVMATTFMAVLLYLSIYLFGYGIAELSFGIFFGICSYILFGTLLKIDELNYFFSRKQNLK